LAPPVRARRWRCGFVCLFAPPWYASRDLHPPSPLPRLKAPPSPAGSGTGKFQAKRGGAGPCNWGKPGDEVFDAELQREDPNYDSCDELFEKAFGKPAGGHVAYDWSAMDDMSDSDNDQMDEIEAKMRNDWMREVEREFKEVEDEAEEWFNGQ